MKKILLITYLLIHIQSYGQESEADRIFNQEKARYEKLAVTYFPDTSKVDSQLVRKMFELDTRMRESGDPIYHSPMKAFILSQLAASALGISSSKPIPDALVYKPVETKTPPPRSQESDEEKKFNQEFEKSKRWAVTFFPDTGTPDSPIIKRMLELDERMRDSDDPIYHLSDKPFILAQLAAAALGISPSNPIPDAIAYKPTGSKPLTPVVERVTEAQASTRTQWEDVPEFKTLRGDSYKRVRIGEVQPDGIRIMHEDGITKIPIENLSEEQRVKYGLAMESAARYRKQVAAANTAAYYAFQKEEAERVERKEQAAQLARDQQAARELTPKPNPVWRRYVDNEAFQELNKEAIAQEIELMDGQEAADRYLREKNAKIAQKEARAAQENADLINNSPRTRMLEGGKYQRRGDRITIDGDSSKGYQIKGDKLYSSSGTPTHTRSGSMWMPLISGEKQIYDP